MNNPNDFYLQLDEKQKWAIRTFLRLEGQDDRADDLSRYEDQKVTEERLKDYEQS
ncbi:MAG: hypothetical protein K0Q73_8547 [Paenibacillus sp.]|nr:hypothetical protein [Paenibacillus sp.]